MTNNLRKLIVPVLASRPVSAIANRLLGRNIPIFSVHRLELDGKNAHGITPGHLRNCLKYLHREGYKLISLEDLILAILGKMPLPDKAVAFTMDDGYAEQADITASIFLEYDCPLTFFVITGMLDKGMWPWDAQVSWLINNTKKASLTLDVDDEIIRVDISDSRSRNTARQTIRDIIKEMDAEILLEVMGRLARATNVSLPPAAPALFQPMDWPSARGLEQKGVRFAPHSRTHRILSKLPDEAAKEEIIGSWDALCRELSNPLKVFCYPTGRMFDFGPREIAYLEQAGFLGATSSISGLIDASALIKNQVFSLPRISLPDTMDYFIQYCSWIERSNPGMPI